MHRLVYDNISAGASLFPSLYGEGALAVPVSGFLKWGPELDLKTPFGRRF